MQDKLRSIMLWKVLFHWNIGLTNYDLKIFQAIQKLSQIGELLNLIAPILNIHIFLILITLAVLSLQTSLLQKVEVCLMYMQVSMILKDEILSPIKMETVSSNIPWHF